ncbi:Wadjet anti-phage system protein JetD domain-containing protein [Ornithinimicrobium cavernae]|uniref:Wadjet anti-phage system protein JetD domain-containing protein n=1 Tax=Ornithinimicrobium cavernae TaxID=2666047 RepID=UPI000D6932EA|nr:Wadjet anti-phage system protein JetD domain-containing protein [Ornithinimicrobium cavernae]
MSRSGAARPWSTVADVRARVRRRWDDGTLLRAYAAGEPFPVLDLPLRRPRASEIGDDLSAVREWVAALDAGRRGGAHYALTYETVGGRVIGRNELPDRAVVSDYGQAWALLGVAGEVRELDRIIAVVAEEPVLRSWAEGQPLKALQVGASVEGLKRAYRWLLSERGSGRYLREVDAPGVDTKFIDQHRPLLAGWLGVPSPSAGFVSALGLRGKPELVRLRSDPSIGLLGGFSEAALRVEELAAVDLPVRTALIVENEITYLSVPVPDAGVVVWGKGFEVDRAGALRWLREADIWYWGDLDTHGFAILDRLRAWLPQTRSVLMDRRTLLEHRDRWGREPSPTSARLTRLSSDEAALYDDLVSDRFAERLRLEQERIDWAWAERHLAHGGRSQR